MLIWVCRRTPLLDGEECTLITQSSIRARLFIEHHANFTKVIHRKSKSKMLAYGLYSSYVGVAELIDTDLIDKEL